MWPIASERGARRDRLRALPGALAVAVLILGCAGPTDPTGSADTPTAGSSGPVPSGLPGSSASPIAGGSGAASDEDLSWILAPDASPTDIGVTLEPGAAKDVVVPVGGGTVRATGSDGTSYSLEIPADSLAVETTVRLTPVASVTGLPFGSDTTYAVQFAPDGLTLYRPAILTITPPEPIPAREQVAFAYRGDGQDVTFAAPDVTADPASEAIRITILHFSGAGATRGLLAGTGDAREQLGGDAEQRLISAMNGELIRIRQEDGEWQLQQIEDAFTDVSAQYVREVVEPRVAAAGTSCAAGRLAMETVMNLQRQGQLMAPGTPIRGVQDYPGLIDRAARACVLEEFELCVEDHVIHRMATVYHSFVRQYALWDMLGGIGDEAVLREARDLTIKCLTFKLRFESTGSVPKPDGGYDSTVSAEIVLRYDPEAFKLSGETALVNDAFKFRAPCGATSVKGGGTFEVISLSILTEGPSAVDQNVNFKLNYLPGATSESALITICGSSGSRLPVPPFPAWTATFLAGHAAELDADSRFGGGYIALDWEVFGGEYFAKKEWIKETPDTVEAGTFKLYHTPGG